MRMHDYLARTGAGNPSDRSVETLRRLHVAHRETFLFENLSIQTGRAISVALEDIERKFLDDKRGGYCFEHNTIFAAVLGEAGFEPVALLGRVRRGPPERWARTHMVLKVSVEREPPMERNAAVEREALAERRSFWLADVGFGAVGLVEPIPLEDGATSRQRGLTYSLRKDGHLWVLAMQDADDTIDLYEFAEEPQTIGDVIVANHYTSTHPDSMFRRTLTIQRVSGDERVILRNETLTRWTNGKMTEETLDRSRLRDIARDLFGVELPEGKFVFEEHRS